MATQIDNRAPPGTLFKRPDSRAKIKETFRRPRERDDSHLAAIRQCPCLGCGEDPAGIAAHVRMPSAAHNKGAAGTGRKPSDKWTVPLCRACHDKQHSYGEITFWFHVDLSPFLICERLYSASPNIEAMRHVCFNVRAPR